MAKGPSIHEVTAYLQTLGFNRIQASGIAGNLAIESAHFAPDVIAGQRRGDNGTAVGLMQWRFDRHENLLRFAKQIGKSPYDWKTQAMFIKAEMLPGQYQDKGSALALQELQKARTVEQATAAFMHAERPQGYTRQNPRAGSHFRQRAEWAAKAAGTEGSTGGDGELGNRQYANTFGSDFAGQETFITDGEFGAETHKEDELFGNFNRTAYGWDGTNPLKYSDFSESSPFNLQGDYSNLNNLYDYDTTGQSRQLFGIEGIT